LNIGIIGCGAVGQKRARHLAGARLVHCADIDLGRATLAASSSVGCTSGTEWREMVDRAGVDAIIIATPQDLQAEIARAAISAGIHVLVEKPAARRADELRELPQLAARHNVRVHKLPEFGTQPLLS